MKNKKEVVTAVLPFHRVIWLGEPQLQSQS
jgi:hypothetical protein